MNLSVLPIKSSTMRLLSEKVFYIPIFLTVLTMLFRDILLVPLLMVTLLIGGIFAYFHYAYKYWEKRNVPYLPPSFPYGNTEILLNVTGTFGFEGVKYYEEIKKMGKKFGGVYVITRPVLVLADPDYVKDIMSTDFQYFVDRGIYHNEADPISVHLLSADETKWRNLRVKLTPTFTSGKIRMMFKAMSDIGDNLVDIIRELTLKNKDIDIREIVECYTTDVIGSCAFGIDCHSLNSETEGEFRQIGKKVLKIKNTVHLFRLLLIVNFPKLARKLGIRMVREDVTEFLSSAVRENLKYRKENNYSRPDSFQLLMELEESTKNTESPFTTDDLIAQVFLFFVAGYDTSSSSITFTLYELCRNEELQEKLRNEINEVLARHDGQITYDSISEMKYLGQVINEAMRIHPPVLMLIRRCIKDYKLKNTDIIIEKGTEVIIPAFAMHRDPDLFPDPLKFDPDRFDAENCKDRHPFSFLPFGAGPRYCIGSRFGMMQSKIGLVKILQNFRLKISSKTKMPLHIDPKTNLTKTLETLYLIAEPV